MRREFRYLLIAIALIHLPMSEAGGQIAAGPVAVDASSEQPLSKVIWPIAVYGADTRGPLPRRYRSLEQSIGQLEGRNRRWERRCTAFCVGEDVIATAAHCLLYPGTDGKRPRFLDVRFRLRNDPRSFETKIAGDTEQTAAWNVLAGSTHGSELVGLNHARDWALAKLAKNVCTGRALKVTPRVKWPNLFVDVARDGAFMVAYHEYGKKMLLRYSGRCQNEASPARLFESWSLLEHISADPEALFLHKCDLTRGASGSPLLIDLAGGPQVIGINVAEGIANERKRPALNNRGSAVQDRMVAELLANNIAISVSAFEKQIGLLRDEAQPMTADKIRTLQARLATTGDYTGTVDGIYGNATRQAILDFERSRGMLPTGRPSPALLETDSTQLSSSPSPARPKLKPYKRSIAKP